MRITSIDVSNFIAAYKATTLQLSVSHTALLPACSPHPAVAYETLSSGMSTVLLTKPEATPASDTGSG